MARRKKRRAPATKSRRLAPGSGSGEQLLRLQHAVTRRMAEAESAAQGAEACLRAICETEGWDCAEFWRLDPAAGAMGRFAYWVLQELPGAREFVDGSRDLQFRPGEGLVGTVWQSGEPLWIRDSMRDPRALRKSLSRQTGLRAALLCPVRSGGQVAGVLAFACRRIRPPDAALLEALMALATQLGLFLRRADAEAGLRQSEERFRQVVDSANEGILVYDRDLKVVTGNAAAARILGVPLAELIGRPGFTSLFPCMREDGSPLPPEERPTRVTTRRGEPLTGMVIGIVGPGGRISWLSVNTGFLRRPGEQEHYGIVSTISDITAQKRGEQLLRLEHQVTRAFTEATDVSQALKGALRAICESEHWECGRYLRVDNAAGELRFGEAWSVQNADIERYIEKSRSMVYGPGVGLVGLVWQSGEPLWVPDITQDPRVARTGLARETGMHGAFAAPVISEGKAIGVCIFQSREIRAPDERLLQAVGVIGGQIGQFVQRAQAEQAMRDSEARFRSLTELSSDWFWELDAEYRFTRLEGRYVTGGDEALRKRLIGSRRWDSGLQVEGGWDAHRVLLEARKLFTDVLMWRTLPDGSLRYITVSGEPMFAADGTFAGYRGVGRDITDEKRAEQLLRLEHRVSSVLSEAKSAQAGVAAVMRLVCEAETWACCRYFEVDKSADELVYRQGWSAADPALGRFLQGSEGLRFKRGQGLSGRVWQSGEPMWSTDTGADDRAKDKTLLAGAARGAFVFGAAAEGETMAVLSFTSRAVRKPDQRLLAAARVVGAQVGQFLRRMKAEASLRESEARFRSLTEMSSDFFWETDTQHRFVDMVHGPEHSEGMGRIVGHTAWDLPYVHPDEAAWAAIRATMDAHRPFRDFEFGRPWPDGSVRYFSVNGDPRFAPDGSFLGYRGVGRDVTSVAVARERIATLAYHDALTGLDNRTSLAPALEKAVERTRRRATKLAGLFLDLDGFKEINDAHGHDAGDRLLVEVANRLRTTLRSSDSVARLGGDEFFVVLEDLKDATPAERVAMKLLAAVQEPYDIGVGTHVLISASIGVSLFPDDAGDAVTLMKHADAAMYAAKQAGKNDYRFFSAGPAANDLRDEAESGRSR